MRNCFIILALNDFVRNFRFYRKTINVLHKQEKT